MIPSQLLLPELLEDPDLPSAKEKIIEGPRSVQFDNLKTIKMSNFKGSQCEMELVKFLLAKDANLEFLVLVAPPAPLSDENRRKLVGHSISQSRIAENSEVQGLYMKLLQLPKASPHVRIIILQPSEDDSSLKPTHTKIYCDENL